MIYDGSEKKGLIVNRVPVNSGYAEIRNDIIEEDSYESIDILAFMLEHFKKTAEKKSKKNYENTILVFCFPGPNEHYILDSNKYEELLLGYLHILNNIKFQANKVYLMFTEFENSNSVKLIQIIPSDS